jgi:hypothetical protein
MRVNGFSCRVVKLIMAAVLIGLTAFLMLGPLSAPSLPAVVTGIAEAGGWGAAAVAGVIKGILVLIDLVGISILTFTGWVDLILCKLGITACCEVGSTTFWDLFSERMQKTNGKLTPQDVKDLKVRTNTLRVDGRITAEEKEDLDRVVDKNAAPPPPPPPGE